MIPRFQELAIICFILTSFVCWSVGFRDILAKHLRLPSDNNNIRHVKSDAVLSVLQYRFISVVGYQPPMNSLHDDGIREHIILTILTPK